MIVDQNPAHVDSEIATIQQSLVRDGLCIIRQSIVKDIASEARGEYYRSMSSCAVAPQNAQFHYRDLNTKPYRKYAVGSKNGNGDPYAQFLQTTYFSKEDGNYPRLGEVFGYLIRLRNQICGSPLEFGNNPDVDGFWNACRVHHYPSGGGFMAAHCDTHFPVLLENSGHRFLQVVAVLSERGRDFETGGGYVVNRQGETIFYEEGDSLGNIICFDGSIMHGVEDVDRHKLIDFNAKSGRLAAFCGLYKVL